MGNCSFKGVVPAEEHHCSTRTRTSSSGIIRVVSDSGRILQFHEPVLVQKFLVDFPGFGIFPQPGRPETPLSGHESLVAGQLFYLLPLSKNKKFNSEVEETEQARNSEEKEKKSQIVKTQICATKTEPIVELAENGDKPEAEIATKKKKDPIVKTEQAVEEDTEMVTKKKNNQTVKTQSSATENGDKSEAETAIKKKEKKKLIVKSKTEQELGEGTEIVTKKTKNQIEPARMSSVEQLTNGSALEVLPSKGNGVWRVKLVINTKQLEEIFSEQVNTEALIEKMRSAASSSSESVTPRTRRSTSGWGVNWKPRVYSVFKLQNESCSDRK